MVYSFRTAPKMSKQHKADQKLRFILKYVVGTEGTLWIDESDRMAVKCEGKNYRTVARSGGFGVSGDSIKKGSTWAWQLKKSGDSWLPIFIMEARRYQRNFRRRITETVTRCEDFSRIP